MVCSSKIDFEPNVALTGASCKSSPSVLISVGLGVWLYPYTVRTNLILVVRGIGAKGAD